MSDGGAITPDRAVVRAFVERIHVAAAAAFAGVSQPGMLQLARIHPLLEDTHSTQFAIGEIDFMVEEAVRQSEAGFNVYIEARTVRKVTSPGRAAGRGKIADTVGAFALVVDDDSDKGKGGHTPVEPSLIVETSPGNRHNWLLLDKALPADLAQALGAAIRYGTGADAATGVLTQPYRIPGTTNYPSKTKLARGRVATSTGIISLDGKVWSADDLRAAFPEKAKPERSAGARPKGASGRTSSRVEGLVAETGDDRSSRFHAAVAAAFSDGLTPDDLEALMRQHPEGCGGKYLEPYDRLAREIERSWEKVEESAEARRRACENPTYEDTSSPIADARRAAAAGVERFLEASTTYRLAADEDAAPPVHGLPVSTGVGKTHAAARTVATHIIERRGTASAAKPILYAVPTHRLGDEIVAQFAEHGVTARVFRGRQAPDPDRPGQEMCDDLEAVKIALSLGATVSTSCCRSKKNNIEHKCPFFGACSYQRQKTDRPEVWIVAHQMIFQAQAALGEVEIVIIDEGFWQTGIQMAKRGLTVDEIGAGVSLGPSMTDYLANDIESYRAKLARALKRHGQPGGVRREALLAEGITTDFCTAAISAEWQFKEKIAIWPGMPREERRKAAKAAEAARHVRGFVTIWKAARNLIADDKIEVSGRLYLDTRDDDDGRVLVAKARRLNDIAKQWLVPTLLLDATMPSLDILRAFYPQIEVAEPIEAALPHVRIRQVIDAPVAARKLQVNADGVAGRNLQAMRREILRRFVELGRKPTLVIAQKAIAQWLRTSGMPEGLSVEHFNNVAGLDQYRAVRLLIVIGRTLPSPVAVEGQAGALTGKQANLLPKGDWYPKVIRSLRTRDRKPIGLDCEEHPDPVAEGCRWLICEGELMQAIGRARGVNRTAADPLDIDIFANVVLPMPVDLAEPWSPPTEAVDMWIEGIVLTSATDMAEAWPDTWPTGGSARVWLHRHTGGGQSTVTEPYKSTLYIGLCNGARRFRYKRPGAGQKWRQGAFDPSVEPDPRGWLEQRLGALAAFEVEDSGAAAAPPASATSRHVVDRYRCVFETAAASTRPAPAIPEVTRWRPSAPDVAIIRLKRSTAAFDGRRRPRPPHAGGAVA